MDSARVLLLRDALSRSGWVERTGEFASLLRRVSAPGRLLLVGTPQDEPWHLTAHLADEARTSGMAQLAPTWVRWSPPPGAPPHLAITMARLETVARGETVFVVAPGPAPETLLERVADARRTGATILAIDEGDEELGSLAHDRLVVPSSPAGLVVVEQVPAGVDLDLVQHLVSVAAGESATRTSMRDRVARFVERMSGPAPRR